MNTLRARPLDLVHADAMPFQQHHEYRTTHPLADVLHDLFFLPLRNQLYPGDSITLCRFDKVDAQRRDARLLEVATVRVVASGEAAKSVPLFLVGPIAAITEPHAPEAETPAEPERPVKTRKAA